MFLLRWPTRYRELLLPEMPRGLHAGMAAIPESPDEPKTEESTSRGFDRPCSVVTEKDIRMGEVTLGIPKVDEL